MSSSLRNNSVTRGLIIGTLIACGFWFGPDIRQMINPSTPTPVAPNIQPALPKVQQPAATPQPTITAVKTPSHTAVAENSFKEDEAAALQRMARTCAFWSARADDVSGRIYRDRSCRDMRAYAVRTKQPVPSIHTIAREEKPTPARPARHVPVIDVNECERHEDGSIRYRQCRATESRRLKNMCQHHRQRDEWQEASRWCSAYDNYLIVD